MNDLLIRLYTCEDFRFNFFNNRDMIFQKYKGLTNNEKKALLLLEKNSVENFSQSLFLKIMSTIQKPFQLLFDHDYLSMKNIFSQFYLTNKLIPGEATLEYSLRFGNFLKQHFYEKKYLVLYNIAKYLTHQVKLKLKYIPHTPLKTSAFNKNLKLILSPNVYVEEYNYDMQILLEPFPKLAKKQNSYYIHCAENLPKPHLYSINKNFYTFLTLCNGIKSFDEVVKGFSNKMKIRQDKVERMLNPIIFQLFNDGKLIPNE